MSLSQQSIFAGITAPSSSRVVSSHMLEDFATALIKKSVVVVEICTGLRIEVTKMLDEIENPEIDFSKQSANFRATPVTETLDVRITSITRSPNGGCYISGSYTEFLEDSPITYERVVPITFHLLNEDGNSITYSKE